MTDKKNRADVWGLACPLETKAVILWLLEQDAHVIDRDEIARALGHHPSKVEDAILAGQRTRPVPVLRRIGPDGERLRPRQAYIPADDPLRRAWSGGKKKKPAVIDTEAPTTTEEA